MYTTRQIKSYTGHIYAEQNELVTVMHYTGHVAIVKGRERFPVLVEFLSEVECPVVVEVALLPIDLFNQIL